MDTFVHCKCTISYDSSGIAHIIHSPKPSYVCILRNFLLQGWRLLMGLIGKDKQPYVLCFDERYLGTPEAAAD